jgi:hypothetical protein
MGVPDVDLVYQYADAFRYMVNERIRPGPRKIRDLLRIDEDSDWEFLCTSMDVIGDANLAIASFLKFGLDGPSRYEDIGERYLRLYGLLTAVYIQGQAVLELCRIMDVASHRDLRKQFDALEIRSLRHKLASHSTDYRRAAKDPTNPKESYTVLRMDLKGFTCNYRRGRSGPGGDVDLRKAVEDHCHLMIQVLDMAIEKSAKRFYKGEESLMKPVTESLNELRLRQDGALIMKDREGRTTSIISIIAVKEGVGNKGDTDAV